MATNYSTSRSSGEKETAKVWPLEKYARLLSKPVAAAGTLSGAKKADGHWQHYSSSQEEGAINMALLPDSHHFIISSGSMIFESFSLWDAQKWLKIVTRGDSAMFIYKVKNENRRFRVKFLPQTASTSAVEACKNFSTIISAVVPVREVETGSSTRDKGSGACDGTTAVMIDSQVAGDEIESSQQQQSSEMAAIETVSSCVQTRPTALIPNESCLIPIPDIGKLLQTQGKSLGRAYADTNFPTDQLGQFIRLCLTDSNFPGFVESVEKELNSMTT